MYEGHTNGGKNRQLRNGLLNSEICSETGKNLKY